MFRDCVLYLRAHILASIFCFGQHTLTCKLLGILQTDCLRRADPRLGACCTLPVIGVYFCCPTFVTGLHLAPLSSVLGHTTFPDTGPHVLIFDILYSGYMLLSNSVIGGTVYSLWSVADCFRHPTLSVGTSPGV